MLNVTCFWSLASLVCITPLRAFSLITPKDKSWLPSKCKTLPSLYYPQEETNNIQDVNNSVNFHGGCKSHDRRHVTFGDSKIFGEAGYYSDEVTLRKRLDEIRAEFRKSRLLTSLQPIMLIFIIATFGYVLLFYSLMYSNKD